MSNYSIRVANDDLLFSASHFITFDSGDCEALHGHDYHVAVEANGPLNASQYVIDFVLLHEVVKSICKELDHRVLVPQNNRHIKFKTVGNELEFDLGNRRWVLPKLDCVLLPVANTTSEMLAQYVAECISKGLSARKIAPPKHISVEIRESNGFTAIYQHEGHE
jgi:6-pyruvoyltetrahydropterin/6-carboxytetrahydropterin synthase